MGQMRLNDVVAEIVGEVIAGRAINKRQAAVDRWDDIDADGRYLAGIDGVVARIDGRARAVRVELFPVGKYVAQIVSSEMRPTKDGGGQYLWLELDVLEGPLAGRKIFDRLNLVNASAQTVEIAQRTLSAICHATGRLQVQDSADLHLIPMIADVTVKPPKNGYGESNKVVYLPLERGGVAAQPRPVAAAAPSGPAAARVSRHAGRRVRLRAMEADGLIAGHRARLPGRHRPGQPHPVQ